MKIQKISLIALLTVFPILFTECASHSVLSSKSVMSVAATHVPADTFSSKKIDSFSMTHDCMVAAIDSLIQNADTACDNENWPAAHCFLENAALLTKKMEISVGDASLCDEYFKEIAGIYYDRMPDDYSDSLPGEISLVTFRKQLAESIESGNISDDDSIMLQKMVNLEKTTCNIPFVWNERVYKALYFLNRGGKGPIDKWIARADYYLPVVKKMFSDSGLPEDIAYLPLIESGFNPLAYSRKRAAGMWQFIPSTGKLYGLKKDFWVDERRDFILSTRAAVSYLKKLYNQFNDWHIAIASYNCGENSMNRALSRSSSNNYWDLKKLPKETRQYVPEFLAAIIMAKNPECKGNADAQHDTFDLDTVTLNGCVSLYAVADTLGLSYDKLHEMNPHILHWCSHPFNSVLMYLPKGTKDKFISAYSNSPSSFSVSWYKYRIKSGEALKSIARHFKTPLDAILTLNNISPKQRLSIGRDLLIPIPVNQKSSNATILAACDERTKPAGRALMVNGVKVVKYKVRNGDCLWDLAQLFRVDREDICKWNNINDATSIKAGMTLTIYKSDKDYKNAVSRQQPAPVVKQTAYDASVRRVVYYKIRKGDNLWNIAQSFKVQIDELTAMNDIDVDTTLIPGDVLKVPVSEKL